MNTIETVIGLFGLSPEDEVVSRFLDECEITERPQYEGNPAQTLSKKDKGFFIKFEGKLGYEKTFGSCRGTGSMVLCMLRVHGPLNADGHVPYVGPLPFGLNFQPKP